MIKLKVFSDFFSFYDNKVIGFPLLISLLFLAMTAFLAVFALSQLPPEVPIFYSTKDQILAERNLIFLFPVVILLALIVNLIIIKIFLEKNLFLAKMTACLTSVVSFLVFWAQLKIILLF